MVITMPSISSDANNGIAVLISLVCFNFSSWQGILPTFLGVTDQAIVADSTLELSADSVYYEWLENNRKNVVSLFKEGDSKKCKKAVEMLKLAWIHKDGAIWFEITDFFEVGTLVRRKVDEIVVAYSFDLRTNEMATSHVPNPNAEREHIFKAYSTADDPSYPVTLSERKKKCS